MLKRQALYPWREIRDRHACSLTVDTWKIYGISQYRQLTKKRIKIEKNRPENIRMPRFLSDAIRTAVPSTEFALILTLQVVSVAVLR